VPNNIFSSLLDYGRITGAKLCRFNLKGTLKKSEMLADTRK